MKPILYALALFTTLAPALAQDAATAPDQSQIQPTQQPSVKLDNGLIVTPVKRPNGDLERMMDVKMWEFNIRPPSINTLIIPRLELRVPGKEPQNLGYGGGSFSHQKNTNFLVGVAPSVSNFLQFADKWKIYYRARDLTYGPGPDDVAAASERDNPIKDLKYYATRYGTGSGYALPQLNGDIPLMTLYKQDGTPNKEPGIAAELVLVLDAETPQPKK